MGLWEYRASPNSTRHFFRVKHSGYSRLSLIFGHTQIWIGCESQSTSTWCWNVLLCCSGNSPTTTHLNRIVQVPYLGFLNPQFSWWNASVWCLIRNDGWLRWIPSGRCSGAEQHGGHSDAHDTDLDFLTKEMPLEQKITGISSKTEITNIVYIYI